MSVSAEETMKVLRQQQYIFQTKPALRMEALFSDGTEYYRSPAQPALGDEITVRFRTAAANADAVYVICNGNRLNMDFEKRSGIFENMWKSLILRKRAARFTEIPIRKL